jgi:hypothetical protein
LFRVLELARLTFALPEGPMIEGKSGEAPFCQSSRVGSRGLLFDRSERPGCDYRRYWRLWR